MDSDDRNMARPSNRSGKIETPAFFDFDAMAALAASDPEAFELARATMLDGEIERMKSLRPARLRGLQFRIDIERRRSKPMATCLHLSTMMWECVYGLQAPLASLGRRITASLRTGNKRRPANDDSFR